MDTTEIQVNTGHETAFVDLTDAASRFCLNKGDGLLSVFVPHATAGLAVFETGAGSERDVTGVIDELLPPAAGRYHHDHGSPGHGRDHVLPALVSPSLTIPVLNGKLGLGTWQSVVLIDTNVDNEIRTVRFSFIAG